MSKKYDTLVYIGRFQPCHAAHMETIKLAAQLAKQVIIVIGSAEQPRTFKNPWTFAERRDMLISPIRRYIPDSECSIRIESNYDTIYDDLAWSVRIQNIVAKHTRPTDKIGLIGCDKDESSFYLKMFPQWARELTPLFEPLNATDIRDLYFRRDVNMNFIKSVVPESVFQFLDGWRHGKEFEQVVKEREFVEKYKKQYENLPYDPIFVTTDAVVIQSGHVLLVKRKSEPGKGLWAFPGGFVNARTDKSIEDAMVRELYEETGIKLPEKVIRGSIRTMKVFDAIGRSSRGRTITHCFCIKFSDGEWNLPKIKAADDASNVLWWPISDVKSEMLFEDHFDILNWALKA